MAARFRTGLLGLAFALTWAKVGNAQPVASSIEELKHLLPSEAQVTVTDANGQETRGRLADASESLVALRIGRGIRRFAAAEIRSVRVRNEDSIVNGTLIGAAVSSGLTSLMFLDNECHDDPVCYQTVAVYAGIGALAGLGIDALIHGSVVVYAAPSPTARHVVAVAPLLARGRKGVRLAIAF